jgi:3-hydroxy-9,10-secoandrosta-1,3,5(10)-triene-9,17-dione monooxygenase reductase component
MPLEPARFREALAHWASGVAIAACRDDARLVATTVSAFMSLSAEPPQVLLAIGPNATIRPYLHAGAPFGVSILSHAQRRLAAVYADPYAVGADPFAGDPPVIHDALTTLVCRVSEARTAADHMLVIADVQAVHVQHDRAPLIRYRRRYHVLAD